MGSRSPAELLGTVPLVGDANHSKGEWLLEFSPGSGLGHHRRGPYKVINARRRTGAPDFIVIAEVLGGIEPGEKGNLRTHGQAPRNAIDRTWPFNASRFTATFLQQRELPMG